MREGYEAEAESDMGPSLALPSISEDDENLPEIETVIPVSPHLNILNRSPLHTSPRHPKFLQRYISLHFNKLFYYKTKKHYNYRGKSLAALRERVERQRSINNNLINCESNSLEGLNLDRDNGQQPHGRSLDKLDNQVTSLHQDVAALSIEV